MPRTAFREAGLRDCEDQEGKARAAGGGAGNGVGGRHGSGDPAPVPGPPQKSGGDIPGSAGAPSRGDAGRPGGVPPPPPRSPPPAGCVVFAGML